MKLDGARKLGSTSVLLKNIHKYVKRDQIWPFRPWKRPLERFKPNRLWAFHLYPSCEVLCKNREKVAKQFWSKWPPSAKRAKFDVSELEKWSLERFNQIYLSICDLCHPKEAPCQKREKVTEAFPRLTPPPSILMDGGTDGQTDDRQIDIRKAPLPLSWRS